MRSNSLIPKHLFQIHANKSYSIIYLWLRLKENNMIYHLLIILLTMHVPLMSMRPDPQKIIEKNIQDLIDGHTTAEQLKKHYNYQQLRDFRDQHNNNLIHIVIKELLPKQDHKRFSYFVDSYKSLLRFLTNSGIDINEGNLKTRTPLYYVYKRQNIQLDFLKQFLENELRAGLAPTIHFKDLHLSDLPLLCIQFLCGNCLKDKYD